MLEQNLKKTIKLRHQLHEYPELSMQEEMTVKTLMHFLQKNTDLVIVPEEGWFYAVKQGKADGRRIAFRADIDALPINETLPLPYASRREGISHKCGHDGHCAALCGLALELDKREIDHTVYLIFQPGEETGEGARICRDLIHKEGISEIYAFHNLPGYPEGSIVYRKGLTQPASEGLRITLTGKTSHASTPEEGNNPAQALSRIALFSQEICKNGDSSGELLLCTVTGIQLGNGDFGISPGKGEICLTLRAQREEEMNRLEKDILSFAAGQSDLFGLSMDYSICDRFPETRNHDRCLSRVVDAAQELHLPLIPMKELWRASEDFGHYLFECPGAMFYIGAGEQYPALHTADYDFNDKILAAAVDMFLAIALTIRFDLQISKEQE